MKDENQERKDCHNSHQVGQVHLLHYLYMEGHLQRMK